MADEPLDFSRMRTDNADNDKDVSIVWGVYRGNASIALFKKGAKGPLLKTGLSSRNETSLISNALTQLVKAAPGFKVSMDQTQWDPEAKKSSVVATYIFGRDDKGVAYIGITGPGVPQAKFLLRTGLRLDASQTMDAAQSSTVAVQALLDFLKYDIHTARLLTSFPRPMNNNQGGGRGGFTGGQQRQASGGFTGGGGQGGGRPQTDVSADEMPF